MNRVLTAYLAGNVQLIIREGLATSLNRTVSANLDDCQKGLS